MVDKVIIFSGKQYSGKDTAAKILLQKLPSFRRCAIGDIIKITYGKQHNLTYEQIEANKAKYRSGLIELGNKGREIDPDFWLKKILEENGNIVVTDVRVPHEYEIFKKANAITIRIEASRKTRSKRGTLVGEKDITEVGLDEISNWDYIVQNDTSYEELKLKILRITEDIEQHLS